MNFPRNFFFIDTETKQIYTLSLHDALPILDSKTAALMYAAGYAHGDLSDDPAADRESRRLNSSYKENEYAVRLLNEDNGVRGLIQARMIGFNPLSINGAGA